MRHSLAQIVQTHFCQIMQNFSINFKSPKRKKATKLTCSTGSKRTDIWIKSHSCLLRRLLVKISLSLIFHSKNKVDGKTRPSNSLRSIEVLLISCQIIRWCRRKTLYFLKGKSVEWPLPVLPRSIAHQRITINSQDRCNSHITWISMTVNHSKIFRLDSLILASRRKTKKILHECESSSKALKMKSTRSFNRVTTYRTSTLTPSMRKIVSSRSYRTRAL